MKELLQNLLGMHGHSKHQRVPRNIESDLWIPITTSIQILKMIWLTHKPAQLGLKLSTVDQFMVQCMLLNKTKRTKNFVKAYNKRWSWNPKLNNQANQFNQSKLQLKPSDLKKSMEVQWEQWLNSYEFKRNNSLFKQR